MKQLSKAFKTSLRSMMFSSEFGGGALDPRRRTGLSGPAGDLGLINTVYVTSVTSCLEPIYYLTMGK